jgi:hypothetical protein
MKFSDLIKVIFFLGGVLTGCGSQDTGDKWKQPGVKDEKQISDQRKKINGFSIAYAIEDRSLPSGFKFSTFLISEPEKVQTGIDAIEATGYIPETHSTSLPFNRVIFLGEKDAKLEANFIRKDLLEMGKEGIQEMTPSFYEWACKAATEHAGLSVDLLKIN